MRLTATLWLALAAVPVAGQTPVGKPATNPATAATSRAATTRPATNPSVDPDLVGWWRADGAAGRTLADASGHGRDASAGAAVVVETVGGRAGVRLTPGGSPLTIRADAAFDFTADFTVALRARMRGPQQDVTLLSKRAADGSDGYAIVHGIRGVGGIGFVASPRIFVPTPVKTADEWTHVAVTFREREFTLYVDGKAIGVNELPTIPASSVAALTVGADAAGKGAMDGWVDDVRVYHRALTAADVETLAGGKEPAHPYAPLSPAEEARVRALIADLGSNAYTKREAAREKLQAMGRQIHPLLRPFRDAEDVEVASRVKMLLGDLPESPGER